ncbi:MAG: glycoside hydrolase family 2 TIM barrel-domain containing protein, partial [Chloroflexota bacterium]
IVLPYHNFDNLEYQFISTYRKRFTLPEPLNGRRLFIEFDGAMTSSQVSINGRTLGEQDGGYVPFSFDLTDFLRDGENMLQVRLDATERSDVPPNGYVVDYLTFGGIYREVRLRYVEPTYIKDVFVKTFDVLSDKVRVECDITLKNAGSSPFSGKLAVMIDKPNGSGLVGSEQAVTLTAQGENVVNVTFDAAALQAPVSLWTPDSPDRYTVSVFLQPPTQDGSLVFSDANAEDAVEHRFGFRDAIFKDDGFYLNGAHFKLIGLNRHQTYPYIGGAAPERLQRKDADILKDELGVNLVRTSHYPQSPHFIERCDEIGLLVMEEIPGWQFIGDSDWKALSLRDVEAMIVRDRNHPSIVLWGVRINESRDDEAFYKATNKLAHDLDPTRQTGGVRYFQDSQFLEDVFTYNDFSNTVVEPKQTPHLITEFNGHMFPTKTFDQEERQMEHALRHARIQDKQLGMRNIAGAVGWCAFDYNTHREFGSGDRICYHGVMDIFRLPKFAADFYAAQGVKAPFVRAATFWTLGDRSASGVDPLYVFSNCDEIDVFLGEDHFGRFQPDHEHFP